MKITADGGSGAGPGGCGASMRDRFDQLSNRVAEAYKNVPVEQGTAEIDAAIAQERRR